MLCSLILTSLFSLASSQVEALDPENDDYIVIDRASLELAWRQQAAEQDPTEPTEQAEPTFLDPLLPPLHHLLAEHVPTAVNLLQGEGLSVSAGFNKTHITIVATLDRQNPLTEARWVKTGEVEPWIASLNLATDKKESVSEWRGKITISDPDPVRSLPTCTRAFPFFDALMPSSPRPSSRRSRLGRRAALSARWTSATAS